MKHNWFLELKQKISYAQVKTGVAINTVLIELYWEIARQIAEKQNKSSWGSSFIEKLAGNFKQVFPEIKGFSRRSFTLQYSGICFMYRNLNLCHSLWHKFRERITIKKRSN